MVCGMTQMMTQIILRHYQPLHANTGKAYALIAFASLVDRVAVRYCIDLAALRRAPHVVA